MEGSERAVLHLFSMHKGFQGPLSQHPCLTANPCIRHSSADRCPGSAGRAHPQVVGLSSGLRWVPWVEGHLLMGLLLLFFFFKGQSQFYLKNKSNGPHEDTHTSSTSSATKSPLTDGATGMVPRSEIVIPPKFPTK